LQERGKKNGVSITLSEEGEELVIDFNFLLAIVKSDYEAFF
jgi:hypothetical protein